MKRNETLKNVVTVVVLFALIGLFIWLSTDGISLATSMLAMPSLLLTGTAFIIVVALATAIPAGIIYKIGKLTHKDDLVKICMIITWIVAIVSGVLFVGILLGGDIYSKVTGVKVAEWLTKASHVSFKVAVFTALETVVLHQYDMPF